MLQPIERSLVEKIYTLDGEGVKTVDEMKQHLCYYVKNDLFAGQNPPPITNRRYHPKDVDTRNHMHNATVKEMLCKVDQINLEDKIKTWKQEDPENHLFLRPCSLSLQRVFLKIGLTQMEMLKHRSFKTYYLHIKQLGRGT